ncbi:hypothetical protein [Helicobacter trogontum]|uniref:hypothetical protein n=1 Tax=Helicobacter trogontum TaxID=50960 RepID=UPI0018F7E74A|nr:hypothetical protein [Helicobacter trogontum]
MRLYLWFGNSACGDFLGNAVPTSLRRMSNTPHSLTLHNPKNSLTILELLGFTLNGFIPPFT